MSYFHLYHQKIRDAPSEDQQGQDGLILFSPVFACKLKWGGMIDSTSELSPKMGEKSDPQNKIGWTHPLLTPSFSLSKGGSHKWGRRGCEACSIWLTTGWVEGGTSGPEAELLQRSTSDLALDLLYRGQGWVAMATWGKRESRAV